MEFNKYRFSKLTSIFVNVCYFSYFFNSYFTSFSLLQSNHKSSCPIVFSDFILLF